MWVEMVGEMKEAAVNLSDMFIAANSILEILEASENTSPSRVVINSCFPSIQRHLQDTCCYSLFSLPLHLC